MAVQPEQQEAFDQNPTTILETTALSDGQQLAIMSQEQTAIVDAFVDELSLDELSDLMGICGAVDPGTDPMPDPDPTPPEPCPDPEPPDTGG